MKKSLYIIITILLLCIFSIDIHATSFKFVWENTLVEVPYGDSVDKYKDIPKAHLYVDDKIASDAKITYNRDGDWLCYLKDVDSTVLKDYYVWYKAYENDIYRPGTCTDYKCKVQFKIIDNIAPQINVLNEEISINQKANFDPLSNVTIFDNCDKNLNISYSPNIETLGFGIHDIIIQAIDASGNKTEASYKLNIIDSSYPTIIKTKSDELIFDIGAKASLDGYFEAYDEIDGNITDKLNYPSINTSKTGEYDYDISVIDSSGNKTILGIKVIIKDLTIPTIELNKESDILNYKTDFNKFDYLKYVKNITDNDTVNYDNLFYETNLTNKVGTYYIRYKYNDGINIVYKDVIIKLVSYEKPIIETESINLIVGKYVDLKKYIKVIDESDQFINNSLIVDDEEVNYYKEGTYTAKVYAINSSGISTEENIEVRLLKEKDYNKLIDSSNGYFNSNPFSDYVSFIFLFSIIIFLIIAFLIFIIILKKRKKI